MLKFHLRDSLSWQEKTYKDHGKSLELYGKVLLAEF